MKRITVVLFSRALGDTLLAVPALRALRGAFPGAEIHLAGNSEVGALLRGAAVVDSVSDSDDPRFAGLVAGRETGLPEGSPVQRSADRRAEMLRAVMREPDLAMVVTSRTDSVKDALASAGITGVAVSPFPPAGEHVAQHLVKALAAAGVQGDWRGREMVQPLWPRTTESGPILIHPGSGAGWKRPPATLFVDVARMLEAGDHTVGVIEGRADKDSVAAMRWSGPVVRPETVGDLAAALQSVAGYVGNDSGVTHLAALMAVPGVALFGPTHPVTWGPLGPSVEVLRQCRKPVLPSIRVCDESDCLSRFRPEEIVGLLAAKIEAKDPNC